MKRRNAAFTLIELLTVIAIIVILAGLLHAAFGAVWEGMNNAKCIHNMRRIGTAAFAYAADNNGNLIPSLWQEPSTPNNLSIPWSRLLTGTLTGQNYLASKYPPVDQAKADGKTVFDCPSRKKAASYDKLHYGENYFPGFDARVNLHLPAAGPRKLAAIERPSITLLFGEITEGYTIYPTLPVYNAYPHHDGMNAFYADGSIRRITKQMVDNPGKESPKSPFY